LTAVFEAFYFGKEEIVVKNQWFSVIIAAVFEVCWVIGLKHATGLWEWAGTLIAIVISFYLLIEAGRKLPIGTVYAVFTGLGTAGTVIAGILYFDEPIKIAKLILIGVLLVGVIGLKTVTTEQNEEKGAEL